MEGPHALRRALPLVVLAGVFFATLDATAKWLVQYHTLLFVVWARYAGQMVVATPIAWHRAGAGFWRTSHLRVQLARSLCLVIATACFVGALRYLPLAEGTAIAFLAPMFAIVLSRPVLGERPTRARWIAAVSGFAGIVILVRPGSAVFHPATALMVTAAVANALYQLLTRKLTGDTADTTLFYSGLVGTVLLSLALPFTEIPGALPLRDWALFLALGVFGGAGHGMLIGAYLRAPASLVAPFTYLHMIWATIYGWLVFSHLPDGLSALGMAIIVGSGVALVLHERRIVRQPSRNAKG
ncbi:MAG TPA: DMT family transporter [Usitatibacter sp.]|nr:DMT family transporter [Usitatibacter sp.]